MIELLSEPLARHMLAAALLAAVAAGVAGTFVVVKRISSVTGGLAHAAFGGVGLGFWLGFDPMLGAAGFVIACAVAIGLAYRRLGTAIDTAVSALWAAGMALGVVLVSPGSGAGDPADYLFGSLASVTPAYLTAVAAVDVAIVAAVLLLYRALAAVAFDEEHSEVIGLPVGPLLVTLLVLIALSVAALIRVAGIILAIALLTLPAEAARRWTASLGWTMVLAAVLAALCGTGGVLASLGAAAAGRPLAPGPLIVLLVLAAYGAAVAVERWRRDRLHERGA